MGDESRTHAGTVREQQQKTVKYIVETPKSVEQAVADLEAAVPGTSSVFCTSTTCKKR